MTTGRIVWLTVEGTTDGYDITATRPDGTSEVVASARPTAGAFELKAGPIGRLRHDILINRSPMRREPPVQAFVDPTPYGADTWRPGVDEVMRQMDVGLWGITKIARPVIKVQGGARQEYGIEPPAAATARIGIYTHRRGFLWNRLNVEFGAGTGWIGIDGPPALDILQDPADPAALDVTVIDRSEIADHLSRIARSGVDKDRLVLALEDRSRPWARSEIDWTGLVSRRTLVVPTFEAQVPEILAAYRTPGAMDAIVRATDPRSYLITGVAREDTFVFTKDWPLEDVTILDDGRGSGPGRPGGGGRGSGGGHSGPRPGGRGTGAGGDRQGQPGGAGDVREADDGAADRRTVDVALRDQQGESVEPTESLAPGEAYELIVAIGLDLDGSAILGDRPLITPHLGPPDRDGWDLSVALIGDGLRSLGRRILDVHLPREGPSEEVPFSVIAPSSDGDEEFWIGVFHRGNLVQLFRVRWGACGIQAMLDIEHVADLSTLSAASSRAVSIVPLTGVAETRMAISAPGMATVGLQLPQIEGLMKRIQDIFGRALDPPLGPEDRAAESPVMCIDGELTPSGHELLCDLADVGQLLHDGLFTDASVDDARRLRGLLHDAQHPVQVYRPSADLTVPWGLAYDWVTGDVERRMCVEPSCDHGAATEEYCVKGFWGVRLVVEELWKGAPAPGAKLPSPSNPADRGVLVTTDLDDDPARHLIASLAALATPAPERFTGEARALTERLWDVDPAPVSLLVMMGHTDQPDEAGPNTTAQIYVDRIARRVLASRDLKFQQQNRRSGRLSPPGPLVLLLGCQTEADQATEMGSLVGGFLGAGAAAVASTLAPVDAEFVARGGADLIGILARPQALGDAVREWRTALLREGNPFALALAVTGDVSLTF